MKVVVLGGSGVFGALLADLLARDGHGVWIAGRNLGKAETVAARIGATALQADRSGDLAPIFAPRPDVVIDAAGPFQAYGDDPYRLPRRCLAEGACYLDLSDAADFTAGIGALDAAARAAGLWALSGASSVPAISAAAVRALGDGMDDISLIDTAILPGNRAPCGRSVIASIVGGVGRPMRLWRGGAWRRARGWSEPCRYDLQPGLTRTAYLTEVPDTVLFPDAFNARSVTFRAGLELWIMNWALACLGRLRVDRAPAATTALLGPMRWLAGLLRPLGTDRGGMQVRVTGRVAGAMRRRTWTLVAEAGDGPYVPGAVARALLRDPRRIQPGARPCLFEIALPEIEAALADLAITTARADEPRPPVFQAALGDRWDLLAPEAQALHAVHDFECFSGLAEITRGAAPDARLAALLFGFPPAGRDVPVTVMKTRIDAGELWERNFAGRRFRSVCGPASGRHRYRERFGPFVYELELPVEAGAMRFLIRKGWCFGIPLPQRLLPGSETREYVADGRFHFDVALSAPVTGNLIVRYRGWLQPTGPDNVPAR